MTPIARPGESFDFAKQRGFENQATKNSDDEEFFVIRERKQNELQSFALKGALKNLFPRTGAREIPGTSKRVLSNYFCALRTTMCVDPLLRKQGKEGSTPPHTY